MALKWANMSLEQRAARKITLALWAARNREKTREYVRRYRASLSPEQLRAQQRKGRLKAKKDPIKVRHLREYHRERSRQKLPNPTRIWTADPIRHILGRWTA